VAPKDAGEIRTPKEALGLVPSIGGTGPLVFLMINKTRTGSFGLVTEPVSIT
jgi:hypothetical protein